MSARVLTGLALAAAVTAVAWLAPVEVFAAAAVVVAVAALWEWNRLGRGGGAGPVAVAVTVAVMLAGAVVVFLSAQKLAVMCLAGALLWVWLAWQLLRPAAGARHSHSEGDGDAHGGALGNLAQGAAVLWLAWCALVWLRVEHGAALALAAVAVVAAADSGAYFAGKRFGRRQLAPAISPGKTVAGLVGGLTVATLGAAVVAWIFAPEAVRWWAAAALVAAAFSVLGDLYESQLKRRAGVKDSGGILPGHGGILDRIDGLVAALPAFALVWQLAEAAE